MAKDKRSFLLYTDVHFTVKKLTDEQAGKLFKHILSYVNDENPVLNDVIIELVFEPIKQALKRDLKRYEAICERNKNNGSKGGRPKINKRKPRKPSGLITNPNNPDGLRNNPENPVKPDNDIDNDSDIGIDSEKEQNKNYIPVFEEFKNYALENDSNVNLQNLELKYKSWVENGWRDGKGKKISNWKSKLLNTIPYIKNEVNSGSDQRSIKRVNDLWK